MTVSPTPPDRVRSQAIEIARGWSAPGAPRSWALTAEIFAGLARDERLTALAAAVPPDRMPALLFAAAACHLVGEERPPGLIEYFPVPGGPQPDLDPHFRPAFATFCLDHRAALCDLFGRRRYQMNEVARTTQVALALSSLAGRAGSAGVALVDIGSGAGLGLHPDRYGHRLSRGDLLGDPTSSVQLECELAGPAPALSPLPAIEWRVGVDLEPLDLADPADASWARSCIPPETTALARFDRAAGVALAHPCPIVKGDALDVLPDVLDGVPGDLFPVVVDTYTAVFFSDGQRARFRHLLERRARHRPPTWISLDPLVPLGTAGRHSVQGIDVPAPLVADYQRQGVFALLGLMTFDGGVSGEELLARSHPSGTTVTWLEDPARPARDR